MASTTNTLCTVKQLGALLQEQQEPFTLEVYLLERNYLKNSKLNSELSNSTTPTKFLKRSVSCNTGNIRRNIMPSCSKFLRAAFDKLLSVKLRTKNPETSEDHSTNAIKIWKSSQETVQEDTFSSANSVLNSYSESDTEQDACVSSPQGCHLKHFPNPEAYMKLQGRIVEDIKQLSRVSVLDESLSSETSPIHGTQQKVKTRQQDNITTTESAVSVPLCRSLDQAITEKPSCNGAGDLRLVNSDPSSQYMRIRMALQQTKQLLLDCVREVVETHEPKDTRRQLLRELMGPAELGKILCDNILTWTSQCLDGSNTIQLLNLDFSASAKEWSGLKQQYKEISMEIGDAILEDINHEIVAEMIYPGT